ncbi:MAG: hypothetical protein QXR96_02330, partial [Candidatus Woesearchaeota archaeon]
HYLVNYISLNFIKYESGYVNFDNIHKVSLEELKSLTNKTEKELLIKKCSNCNKTKCVCKKNDYKDFFDSLSIVNVDTILISPRHLFRSPYSMHEKSNLVSIPIPIGKILTFDKKEAEPENVIPDKLPIFLDSSKAKKNEAENLIISAFDYDKQENILFISKENEKKIVYEQNLSFNQIPIELFPPCILKILQGLEDGKKRSLFILINFLSSLNWPYDKIEALLLEWNKKNKEPLKESLIKLQVKYHSQKKKFLPPNCKQYYQDFNVCQPDFICNSIKNPVQYSKRKYANLNKTNHSKKIIREKLTEEQKEMRRKYREKLKKQKEEQEKSKQKESI